MSKVNVSISTDLLLEIEQLNQRMATTSKNDIHAYKILLDRWQQLKNEISLEAELQFSDRPAGVMGKKTLAERFAEEEKIS